jgi:hypothetical protein
MNRTPAKLRHNVYLLRLQRLTLLISERFGDEQRFAKRMQWSPEWIAHFLSSGSRRWYITDRVARDIENKIGLAEFWLDGEHTHGDVEAKTRAL